MTKQSKTLIAGALLAVMLVGAAIPALAVSFRHSPSGSIYTFDSSNTYPK